MVHKIWSKIGDMQLSSIFLTFVGPCIANIFSEYDQQDATLLRFIYFCKTVYMFQTVFLRPSSGAQNCTYSVRHLLDRYCYLLLAWTSLRSFSGSQMVYKIYLEKKNFQSLWRKFKFHSNLTRIAVLYVKIYVHL